MAHLSNRTWLILSAVVDIIYRVALWLVLIFTVVILTGHAWRL